MGQVASENPRVDYDIPYGLATQDIIMQGPHAPYSELYSMPGPSSDINMHQPAIPTLPLNQPFTSGLYAVWGKEKITICSMCSGWP